MANDDKPVPARYFNGPIDERLATTLLLEPRCRELQNDT